jgi:hypothetical protein
VNGKHLEAMTCEKKQQNNKPTKKLNKQQQQQQQQQIPCNYEKSPNKHVESAKKKTKKYYLHYSQEDNRTATPSP